MSSRRPIHRAAVTFNGIGIAYVIGLVNAAMAAVNAFGLHLDDTQRVAIVGLVNAALVLAIHLSHRVGEVDAAGGSGAMSRAQTAKIVDDHTPSPVEAP